MSLKIALSTSCIVILILSISLILFQRVSATPEREGCVAWLVQIQENPEMMGTGYFNTIANAVKCLALNEGRESCVAGLVQMQGNPNATATEAIDTNSNAVECLSLSELDTTERKACVTELVRIMPNPNATIRELVDTISNAVICIART
jgi:hypothetical protein